jgi:hypothetical protein
MDNGRLRHRGITISKLVKICWVFNGLAVAAIIVSNNSRIRMLLEAGDCGTG